jgi:SAM-dependent methyltransferase
MRFATVAREAIGRGQATLSARMRLLDRLTDPSQFDLHTSGTGSVLDVGCGSKKHPGAVGIDRSADTDADVVHDLDAPPWPIADRSFDEILLQDVLEHLRDPYAVFAELHRIARPGGRIQLRTPHFSSALAYSDPTHVNFFSAAAIRSLAEPGFEHYSAVRFRVVSLTLDLWLPFRLVGIAALANRWPDTYERYFAFRFPAMNIRAEFEVLKA